MKRSNVGRNAAKWLGCGVLAISAAACASDKTPAKEPVAMGEMTAPGPQSPEGDRERAEPRASVRPMIVITRPFSGPSLKHLATSSKMFAPRACNVASA